VSDNTIDNHRKGMGDVSHAALRLLTERAGLPESSLYLRWHVDDGVLVLGDGKGQPAGEALDPHRSSAEARYDDPPLAYQPGRDLTLQPIGLAEEDDLAHLAVPGDYLGRLKTDARNLLAMLAADDAMAPEIEDGAFLLVDVSDKQLSDGCLYVIDAGSGPTIRRVRHLSRGRLELLSGDSARHPPESLTKADLAALGVIGRLRSHSKVV
jgi:hypothetical protein